MNKEGKIALFKTEPKNNLVSIIIPAYGEAGNIALYEKELIPELEKLPYDYEVIITEDGTTDKKPDDKTWEELVKLQKKFPQKVSVLRHSRNYGMSASLQSGVDHASGDYIIFYAADLEISPSDISKVIKKLDEGYDVVNTVRGARWTESGSNKILRKIPSYIANLLIHKLLGVKSKDNGSGLKGYKRFIIENMRLYGEMQRMMFSYSGMYTKKMIEIPVEYYERKHGESYYGGFANMIRRTFEVVLDLMELKFMSSFSVRPFHLKPGRAFGFTGIVILLIGSLISFYMFIAKFFQGQDIGTRPLFTLGLIFIVMGVQMIMMGMLGELMTRIYYEGSNTKNYVVAEKRLAKDKKSS